MNFTHVFISRPLREAEELAEMLSPLGLHTIVQPAFNYYPVEIERAQPDVFAEMSLAGPDTLVVFTSPRAVAHGLSQLPESLRFHSRIAAIGPATARALSEAGVRVSLVPKQGYTSEALLETLSGEETRLPRGQSLAFIIAAPGGRQTLFENLERQGWQARMVMVYQSEPAELDKTELDKLQEASGVLSVWTSANTMQALSQRLQPAIWFQLTQGHWLVISERLKRLARAYGPKTIHVATGPGNQDLFSAIRNLG